MGCGCGAIYGLFEYGRVDPVRESFAGNCNEAVAVAGASGRICYRKCNEALQNKLGSFNALLEYRFFGSLITAAGLYMKNENCGRFYANVRVLQFECFDFNVNKNKSYK